jgi:hypothetical protein
MTTWEQIRSFGRALVKLLKIEKQLLEIEIKLVENQNEKDEKGETNMDQTMTDLIAAFDAATDRIAKRIQGIIGAGQITSPDVKAALQAEVDKLNTLGQDPANPVPVGV